MGKIDRSLKLELVYTKNNKIVKFTRQSVDNILTIFKIKYFLFLCGLHKELKFIKLYSIASLEMKKADRLEFHTELIDFMSNWLSTIKINIDLLHKYSLDLVIINKDEEISVINLASRLKMVGVREQYIDYPELNIRIHYEYYKLSTPNTFVTIKKLAEHKG